MDRIETLIIDLMRRLQIEANRRLGMAMVKLDISISAPKELETEIKKFSAELQAMMDKARSAAMEDQDVAAEKVSLQ